MYILFIDSDKKLIEIEKKSLEAEGYKIDEVYDGIGGLKMGLKDVYDIIILDITLPKKNGFEVCKELRKSGINVPILVLSTFNKVQDKVKAFESGADDYLTKPFAFQEFLVRIKSLCRRGKSTKSDILEVGDLRIDLIAHEVKRGTKLIKLTHKEYLLLEYLMKHPDKVFNREELSRQIWGLDYKKKANPIDVYIRHLRKKIDDDYKKKLIQTVRGTGYKIIG